MRLKSYIPIILITFLYGCKKDTITQEQPYQLAVPDNFPSINTFYSDNPLSKDGIELGRKLFYDVRLSGNNQVNCASCHQQDKAFSDGKALTNVGVSGITLHRHSPSLINVAWHNNGLFWDGGSTNLESQAFAPITNADEMAQNLYELEDELKQVPEYVSLFRKVFNDTIKSNYVARALAQFQRTLISSNAKYDKFVRNEENTTLTTQELQGLNLVKTKCQHCHSTDLFTDDLYHNNGIDDDFSNTSFSNLFLGRFRITNNIADIGKYKTPTLRNVMLTAPYMHDGRFATIEDVLHHYSNGVKISTTTDPFLIPNNGIPLTNTEKQAIIAFLHTLTDYDFISNPNFAQP